MAHDHHYHHHHHDTTHHSDARLVGAVVVNLLLTAAQIGGGIVSGSLALVADALHNLNDAVSLGLALLARRIARKPADRRRTFGYRRAELIGALINLTTLMIVGLYLIYEAIWRFFDRQEIAGWIVIVVAGVALVVDIVTAALTFAMSRGSLNIKAAFVHNLSDALASVAVIVAGTLILLYDWYWADLAATLAISTYILVHGAVMMRDTIRILMDSVPEDIDLDELVAAMRTVDHVTDVHHVHVRQLDEHCRALEAHIVLTARGLEELEKAKTSLKALLRDQFDITHSTLEAETPSAGPHARNVVTPH